MMSERPLEGRVALITGAAHGLGRAIGHALSSRGAFTVLTDVDEEGVGRAAENLSESLSLTLDVGDPTAVDAAFRSVERVLGPVDTLVNNAGFQRVAPIYDYPEEDWDAIVRTILTGTFLCTKRALPGLRASGRGTVVNIASVHGLVASPMKSAYVAAKHGVVGFTKALALEEAENSVTANAVCPGYIRTALAEDQIVSKVESDGLTYEEAERLLVGPMPTGRMLEVEEVTALVCYLCSESARGVTGSAIPIDGGWTAR